jgi:adenylosuccinate lyase
MGARLTDSAEYAHLWGTEEVRAIFDQDARRQAWIEILIALAEAQAELGIIPSAAAAAISEGARADRLDLELLAAETRRTSHSTLGFIAALKATLPADAAEYVSTASPCRT